MATDVRTIFAHAIGGRFDPTPAPANDVPAGVATVSSAAVDAALSLPDDPPRCIAEVAAVVVAGVGKAASRRALFESLRAVPGLEALTARDVAASFQALRRRGRSSIAVFLAALEDSLAELARLVTTHRLRRETYQLAIYFTVWDGPLSEAHAALLDAVAEAFGLAGEECVRLLEQTCGEMAGELAPRRRAPSSPD